ncbi:hypothetical protein D917_04633, partial [Trichinella nativa]
MPFLKFRWQNSCMLSSKLLLFGLIGIKVGIELSGFSYIILEGTNVVQDLGCLFPPLRINLYLSTGQESFSRFSIYEAYRENLCGNINVKYSKQHITIFKAMPHLRTRT